MDRVRGKNVVVTGAGAGIGRECVRLFAEEGAAVFGISRTRSTLDETMELASKHGVRVGSATADLSDANSSEAAIQKALSALGRIDVLINAAGVGYNWSEVSPGSMADIVNTPPDKWREVMGINLDSVFYTCRLVVPTMKEQGSGSIVNIASIYGLAGAADAHTYTATKAAIINLTRSMCIAYAKDNIRANCVAPGFVDTKMVAAVMPLFKDPAIAEQISPMRRAATPREIAYACLFLGSDEASYCNGSVLVADGGSTAH